MDKIHYTITSALPYANGPLHIGHLAGAYLPADIFARYMRKIGNSVIFVCGSDEHGVAISIKAMQSGLTPNDIIDKYHKMIGDAFSDLGISFDIYHRTSSQTHKKIASDFFKNIYDKNIFVKEYQKQYYDEEAKQFLADRYIVGTCPHCLYEKAYGDQCEKCGSSLNMEDLINPISTLSNTHPVLKDTYHWMLPLDKFQSDILNYIESKKDTFRHNVYKQCLGWIKQGLKPRAVTRDLNWGIPVPLNNVDNKVLYVWFEAPIGYISATKELFASLESDYPKDLRTEFYISNEVATKAKHASDHWQSKNSRIVHFIGKDNIVFHTIIFQAILLAYGGGYQLPYNVVANEFLNLEGEKISTSKNWAVWLHEYLQDFPNMQDSLRYYLCATAPETKDSDFTWESFQMYNNNELVAIFGNFVNRVITLITKYFNAYIPPIVKLREIDEQILNDIALFPSQIGDLIESYNFRDALRNLMDLARLGNKYLTDNEPWKVIKTNQEQAQTTLAISMQIVIGLYTLAAPFLPFTAKKMQRMLNINRDLSWDYLSKSLNEMINNHKINETELLFRKIETSEIDTQIQKLKNMAS
ncbi:MAG: methionine--tRNA ligase [Solitalea-like symbiont of Tyrophagus putrescentiae]